MEEAKKCTGPCQRTLLLDQFGRRQEAPDGLQYRCNNCRNRYKRDDYSRKKDRILRYQRDRRKKIRGKMSIVLEQVNRTAKKISSVFDFKWEKTKLLPIFSKVEIRDEIALTEKEATSLSEERLAYLIKQRTRACLYRVRILLDTFEAELDI